MLEKNWRAGVVREGFSGPLNLKGEFGIQRRDKPCKDLKANHSMNWFSVGVSASLSGSSCFSPGGVQAPSCSSSHWPWPFHSRYMCAF